MKTCIALELVTQLDDICYLYLGFCDDHLYFRIQATEKYSTVMYYALPQINDDAFRYYNINLCIVMGMGQNFDEIYQRLYFESELLHH